MKQGVNEPRHVARQVATIYAGVKGCLDDVPVASVRAFESQLGQALDSTLAGVRKLIEEQRALTDEVKAALDQALAEFKRTFKG
jgi:F-type H+-transporting ATPase subunit alpha